MFVRNLGECRSSGCNSYIYIFFYSFQKSMFAVGGFTDVHPSQSNPSSVSLTIWYSVPLGVTFLKDEKRFF